MSKATRRDLARIIRSIKRPPRGALTPTAIEPQLTPAAWAKDVHASGIAVPKRLPIRWPLPFETLSPVRTVGKEGANLQLLHPTYFESQQDLHPTGYAAWDAGDPGVVIVRFRPASYGYTDVGTFLFAFTLRAVFVRASFQFLAINGSLVGSTSVSVAANTTATVTATVTNVAASTVVEVVLSRISGGSWYWFQTAIREPGFIIWPPIEDVLGNV